jgi:hypothetical protein
MFGYHDRTSSADSDMEQPVVWITNDMDRSPGELVRVTSDRWGGLKGMLVSSIGNEVTKSLASGAPVEVYQQTRSILGSVRHLYSVGSNLAATLILLFSVIVPFTKSLLVTWAVCQSNPGRRQSTLLFVEMIAKWSMADVFAVAVMIAYLAAH